MSSTPVAASQAPADDGPALSFPVVPIERVEAPDVATFARRYLHPMRPVVLTGMTREWLPASAWTMPQMVARHGEARVLAARLTDGTLRDDSTAGDIFHHVRLRDFVESLAGGDAASAYVMAPTWNFAPAFSEEYRVPPYCAGARHLRAKVWLGKRGTVTPLHRDVPHNLHVQLGGRKRWLLVAPRDSSRMYPRGLFSDMPNFASVDPEAPDDMRHPRFRGATVFAATLDAGETLFIPHGWWHHTRSLDDAVSMNFWWGGRVVQAAALASAAFKRLRGIRQNEWA